MNRKPECENIPEEQINLYDYWKVLVKRKKVFFGIFLVPLVIVTIISLILPRHYRGESEIINPLIPAPAMVNLFGYIDDTKKVEIFAKNSAAVKSVFVSLSPKSTNRVSIIIDAKSADIVSQAFQDLNHYLVNLRESREEIDRSNRKFDLQLAGLIETKKANLIFSGQITDLMKKGKISCIAINPTDIIKKDADLSLEISNLQQAKTNMLNERSVSPPLITEEPSNSLIKTRIIITGTICLFIGIFVVYFLDYIDRMKAREKDRTDIQEV